MSEPNPMIQRPLGELKQEMMSGCASILKILEDQDRCVAFSLLLNIAVYIAFAAGRDKEQIIEDFRQMVEKIHDALLQERIDDAP